MEEIKETNIQKKEFTLMNSFFIGSTTQNNEVVRLV